MKIDGGGKRGVTDNGSGVLNDRERVRGTRYGTGFSMIERQAMMGDRRCR